jgi:hypothetical protein
LPLCPRHRSPPSRGSPNIVILFADDMGYHDAGFNGRKEWTTPNLDRLASQGTIFDGGIRVIRCAIPLAERS